jgi:hypothetical protein
MADLTGAIWRKSTRSGNGGSDCVEVATNLPGVVGVRDTKDHGTGPILTFSPDEWSAFTVGVQAGEFDRES